MIQLKTIVHVSDNSGAKTAVCIKVLGGYKKRYAKIGDYIVVSIKSVRNKSGSTSKVRKGDVCKAIVIRTTKNYSLSDGSTIFFSSNCISLVTNQGIPLSKRIFGPVISKFRGKQLSKFGNISSGII